MIYLLMLYGDFDMLYTDSVWQGSPCTIPNFDHDKNGLIARKWLKENGFSEFKFTKIVCGGDC